MTETERKALALVHSVSDYEAADLDDAQFCDVAQALCRAIEKHEAFRQEVSDAITGFDEYGTEAAWERLSRFIIAKPDPLVEVIADYKRTKGGGEYATNKDMAAALRAALAARGLQIVEVGHD